MPTYRQIHVKIWKDGWFLDLPSDHKLLFIYLFSNERANLFGLYDLPLKVICFETELDPDTVTEGLARFTEEGKAFYEDGWVWVRSLLTYNAPNLNSPKIQGHLQNVLAEIPDIPLKARALRYYDRQISYTSDTDTPSIPDRTEQEQEQETEQQTEQETEQQQHTEAATASVDAVAGHEMLLGFDVSESGAAKYAGQPLAHIEGWITDAKAKGKKLDNPQGYVIANLKTGIPPPSPEPVWKALAGDHLCPTCFARPCMCEQFEEVTA